ncbi:MAG: hypothetical protein ACOZBL_00050 [Patescibacteria group bacterium]
MLIIFFTKEINITQVNILSFDIVGYSESTFEILTLGLTVSFHFHQAGRSLQVSEVQGFAGITFVVECSHIICLLIDI